MRQPMFEESLREMRLNEQEKWEFIKKEDFLSVVVVVVVVAFSSLAKMLGKV